MKQTKYESPALVFTHYVSVVGSGTPPPAELFEELWQALRAALISEMKKRSAWSTPPSYLGVLGCNAWALPNDRGLDDPLDELLSECFSFVFLRRIEGLVRQLAHKPNIDGLVFRSIRNFLHDTQRKHDPLGYRVFERLRAAIDTLVARGQLRQAVAGRLLSASLLSFQNDRPPATAAVLSKAVAGWAEEVLPKLFHGTQEAHQEVVRRLARRLSELPEHGVNSFVLGELLQPLKANIRGAWAAQLAQDQGAVGIENDEDRRSAVLLVEPEPEIEDRDLFRKLVACIDRQLRASTAAPKSQRYLLSLWAYLRAFAAGDGSLEGLRQDGRLPSHRRLAKTLDIPRDRLPGMFKALGKELQHCHAAISTTQPVSRLRGGESTEQQERDRQMSRSVHYDTLRQLAAEDAGRRRLGANTSRSGDQARIGDVLLEPTTSDLAVEWVVIDRRETPASLLLIPADDDPLIGSRDLATRDTQATGPLVLRCGFGLWLSPDRLHAADTCNQLEEGCTAAARRIWEELESGVHKTSLALKEADLDPLYQDRSRFELAEARRRLSATPGATEPQSRSTEPNSRWRHWGKLQLAASLLLLLGSGWLIRERSDLQQFEQRLLSGDLALISLPEPHVYRGHQSPTTIYSLPADDAGYTLDFPHPPKDPDKVYNSYRIILNRAGHPPLVRSALAVAIADDVQLRASFSRRELYPGVYLIEVLATSASDGEETLLQAEFEFEDQNVD